MALPMATQSWGEGGTPAVILHGLLGAGRNWQTLGRALASDRLVVAPDLRNHGQSPHTDDGSLDAMIGDLFALSDVLAEPIHLVGHSLGGKIAMLAALQAPERFASLAVLDMAPLPRPNRLTPLLEAMQAVDLNTASSRKDVDVALQAAVPDARTRAFLLTNIKRTPAGLRWQVNLAALCTALPGFGDFAPTPESRYAHPTLFIRGGQSPYIDDAGQAAISRWFPTATLTTVPAAGHWVHADAPDTVREALLALWRG